MTLNFNKFNNFYNFKKASLFCRANWLNLILNNCQQEKWLDLEKAEPAVGERRNRRRETPIYS